jgi:hypothetical protein
MPVGDATIGTTSRLAPVLGLCLLITLTPGLDTAVVVAACCAEGGARARTARPAAPLSQREAVGKG